MPLTTTTTTPRLLISQLRSLYDAFSPYSYALMRFATGAVLVPHGVQKLLHASLAQYATNIGSKGIPFAYALAVLVFFTEFVAAAFLAIGLFTRAMALMIFIEMAVIITVFNLQYGYFWTNRGVEYALLWALLCVAIFFRGGGRYSVDNMIGVEI